MVSRKEIRQAAKVLVKAYKPKAIYLFGSYAWGTPTKDSDVDFFIVLRDEAEMAWDAFRIATFAFDEADVAFPTDVLVDKEQTFESRAEHPSSLEFKIKKDGIKLYRTTRRLVTESRKRPTRVATHAA
jgi:uncharacterized protein